MTTLERDLHHISNIIEKALELGIDPDAVDRVIELLDHVDGDPDLEPSNGSSGAILDQEFWSYGNNDDREPDGDEKDTSCGGVDDRDLPVCFSPDAIASSRPGSYKKILSNWPPRANLAYVNSSKHF